MAKKKGVPKTSKQCSCEGLDPVVVASKVKAYVNRQGMMSSSELISELSCKVYCMLDAAMERTKANRRTTVKPQDL